MAKEHSPRRGSMAFRPRGRVKSKIPRVRSYPKRKDVQLLGFAGYKVGMTHAFYVEESKSHLKGHEVFTPVTVLETPPMVVFGIRFYKNNQVLTDFLTEDDNVLKKLKYNKRAKEKTQQTIPEDYDNISVLIFTQPSLTNMGKKTIERMEIAIGGDDAKQKLEYAQSILGKEININDIFKQGEYLDAVGITTGKGWQGVVKRFGVPLNSRKATQRRRHGGVIGTFKPPYVMYTIPRAGQMGYHKRTEMNKLVVKLGDSKDNINPSSGFSKYGIVKNNYVLIKGSLPGPSKRLIRLRKAMRKDLVRNVNVTNVSLDPQNR